MTKLVPIANNVVAVAIDDQSISPGGIIIPDTVEKKRPMRAKVLDVGPGKVDEWGVFHEVGVSVGDIVYFEDYAPFKMKVDGEEMLIITENYLLAKETPNSQTD